MPDSKLWCNEILDLHNLASPLSKLIFTICNIFVRVFVNQTNVHRILQGQVMSCIVPPTHMLAKSSQDVNYNSGELNNTETTGRYICYRKTRYQIFLSKIRGTNLRFRNSHCYQQLQQRPHRHSRPPRPSLLRTSRMCGSHPRRSFLLMFSSFSCG